MDASFGGGLVIFIDVVALVLEIADVSLGEIFAEIFESDVEDAIVVD